MKESAKLFYLLCQFIFSLSDYFLLLGFPCGSAGEESDCNEGDLVQSLDWEDPLEKVKGCPLQYSCPREFHELYSPWDGKEVDTPERLSLSDSLNIGCLREIKKGKTIRGPHYIKYYLIECLAHTVYKYFFICSLFLYTEWKILLQCSVCLLKLHIHESDSNYYDQIANHW